MDAKFGRPHCTHSHDTLFKAVYTSSGMYIHSWWYHSLHESHWTPGVVHFTAFLQIPQGYLGVRGPGFGSEAYDSKNRSIQRYNSNNFSRQTVPFLREIAVCMQVNSCTQGDSFIVFGRMRSSLFTLPCTFGAILVDINNVESRKWHRIVLASSNFVDRK